MIAAVDLNALPTWVVLAGIWIPLAIAAAAFVALAIRITGTDDRDLDDLTEHEDERRAMARAAARCRAHHPTSITER